MKIKCFDDVGNISNSHKNMKYVYKVINNKQNDGFPLIFFIFFKIFSLHVEVPIKNTQNTTA